MLTYFNAALRKLDAISWAKYLVTVPERYAATIGGVIVLIA
ncbi:hypothetical protein L580_0671 [Serratia fonticola AU-P3(3)]|nr:hypothetical protein L580_0671 [Serratia fonticola AU-P3(3)]